MPKVPGAYSGSSITTLVYLNKPSLPRRARLILDFEVFKSEKFRGVCPKSRCLACLQGTISLEQGELAADSNALGTVQQSPSFVLSPGARLPRKSCPLLPSFSDLLSSQVGSIAVCRRRHRIPMSKTHETMAT
jgi:hypothetical protein